MAVLLTAIGSDTYALLRSLLAPTKPRDKTFQDLTDTLQRHFDPKPLVIAERFHFHRRDQAEGESVSEYLAELRRLATHCEFEQYLEQVLRDRLVCGIRHDNTQKRLLLESNLSLTKAVDIARSVEAAEKQSTQLKEKGSANASQVLKVQTPKTKELCDKQGACIRCGTHGHQTRDCHHKNAKCFKCGKTGHLAKVCKSRLPNKPSTSQTGS